MQPYRGGAGFQKFRAAGRLKPGDLNKTELQYDDHLKAELRVGNIQWFKWHAISLRLADNTFYKPDVLVLTNDGALEVHEVKGNLWTDDARVKIKVAASLYPFTFIAVQRRPQRVGGGWNYEGF